ncbi:MC037 [Molluscum contagiosum virus subtype 2]|uniref:Protein E6 homolog n=2 Tax=Molluscum contagiosum virus TaxID=10279 RepID=A0A1S7DLM3_MCV2|nr:MC037 [Molluscum contagiosum virus subtype 2]QHW16423.1 MC037R [Molluscum contagiosum virus]AYO87672.1 MC037 [Molluscum contagiosum virus subtype 2]AYO87842.1 MC037 [Molluscum contagiosum virus subtype 2]AYO88012.1 MC037 [Molluscum contagiosum virus subtype 2]
MDFIRRKYLLHTVERNMDFLRAEVAEKVANFALNHVLALRYLVAQFPRAVLTKDVFANVNFHVFLHVVRCAQVYDAVLRSSFDATTLYVRALARNYQAFADTVQTYRELCQTLLQDKRFLEVARAAPTLADVIGVNYDTSLNPLFLRGEPVRDMELIFTKLFRKTEFRAVKKLAVLRLLLWAYLCKQDTGLDFADNDAQDLYSLFQKTGPVVHSEMTERFKAFMFAGEKTSYWVWLQEPVANDADIFKERPARGMYERLLSYLYSELKQGRVNKNMLKLVYIFDSDPSIRSLVLEIIYGVPGDILGVVDSEDETWKAYFVGLYREHFVDGRTFTSTQSFFRDLFRVVARVDPEHFGAERFAALFNAQPEARARFDDMDVNTTFVSRMVYQTPDLDLLALERNRMCQIYSEDTQYYVKEYNTFLFLHEDDPVVIDEGALVRLSSVPSERRRSLLSEHVLKYWLDGQLARLGLVLSSYDDVVLRMVTHMKCLEDVTAFVDYATRRNASVVPAVTRSLLAHFNVPVLVLFQRFLREHLLRVREVLDRSEHLTEREKKYILQIITHGRS